MINTCLACGRDLTSHDDDRADGRAGDYFCKCSVCDGKADMAYEQAVARLAELIVDMDGLDEQSAATIANDELRGLGLVWRRVDA